jgi:hypothetical protein
MGIMNHGFERQAQELGEDINDRTNQLL